MTWSRFVIIMKLQKITLRERRCNMKNEVMISLRGEKTQREIAKKLDVPLSTYAMIETGHRFPRRDLQLKLADFFGVTVDELFFTKNDHEMRSIN